MSQKYLITAAFFVLVSSCKNDFEVNAPWKEITIVYGLLNQKDNIQYIKVRKAFLGDQDALVMAQQSDSSNYPPGSLDVLLIRMQNGLVADTIHLDTTTSVQKYPGIFATDNNIMYKTNGEEIFQAYDYMLRIINKKSGKIITATSPVIDAFTITKPGTNPNPISFYYQGAYRAVDVEWFSAKDGRRYQLTIRIHYNEKNINTGVITPKTIDWLFPAKNSADLLGGTKMEIKGIDGEDFYKLMASKIPVDNNVERYFGSLDFIIDVAGDELNTYMEVNQPSTGIVQEKPEYTNIRNNKNEDEIGIFSCRYSEVRAGKLLNFDSEEWLKSGVYTSSLGFK